MIAPAVGELNQSPETQRISDEPPHFPVSFEVIARYGRVPQVAKFGGQGDPPQRSQQVVVTTERGHEIAEILHVTVLQEDLSSNDSEDAGSQTGKVLRLAGGDDLEKAAVSQVLLESEFTEWSSRIAAWQVQVELIDLESTLDDRLVLYVLNDRGPETTRLALLAAAGGFGIVHVQPVTSDGVVPPTGGGCGSCGGH